MTETSLDPEVTPVHSEIEAMNAAYEALAPLDPDARRRALTWLRDKFYGSYAAIVGNQS